MMALLELDVGPDTLCADCKAENLSETPSLRQQASSSVLITVIETWSGCLAKAGTARCSRTKQPDKQVD